MQEAQAASALDHPNIITVHDIDTADGVDFIAMELVPGEAFSQDESRNRGYSVPAPGDVFRDQVIFAAESGDSTSLWTIRLSPRTWRVSGDPRRLTFGTSEETQPTVAPLPGGVRLVFAGLVDSTHIWSVPIEADKGKVPGEPQRLTRAPVRNSILLAVKRSLVAAAAILATVVLWAQSLARYGTEDDAVAAGAAKDLGSAALEGPAEVEVDTVASWTLRFTAGRAGLKTGGGIRMAFAHGMGGDWGGHHFQTADPAAGNYLTVSPGFRIVLKPWRAAGATGPDDTFRRYHPWQWITEFVREGRSLEAGEVVSIGMSRVRVQQRDETAFLFKLYVDTEGDDDYLPLAKSPSMRVHGSAADLIVVNNPADAVAGQPVAVTAWVSDRYANPARGFTGTLRVDSDPPQLHKFSAADQARHRFDGVVFARPGVYRVEVRQTDGPLRAASGPIRVHAADPAGLILWGDIHTHTAYSDGRGSVAETYQFGRDYSALDFAAVTDHSFLVSDSMWRENKEVTNRFHKPGEYVTFLAYEWSGTTDVGGDHNVYFRDGDAELTRCYSYYNYQNLRMYHGPNHGAGHVEELFRVLGAHLRGSNILAIPHFGGRRGNPEWHDPRIQRLIEIYSDHRRSEDWARTFLDRRYRIGIMASTDNHAGNAGYGFRIRPAKPEAERPEERSTSLVAVYAPARTREAIFDALYRRHTYATTGNRMLVEFRVNGALMGEEIRSEAPPRIQASVEGTAPLDKIYVLRNSRVIYAQPGEGLSARFEYVDNSAGWKGSFYYLRAEQKDGEQAISSPVWVD